MKTLYRFLFLCSLITFFLVGYSSKVTSAHADSTSKCMGLLEALENIPPDSPGYTRVQKLVQEENCGMLTVMLTDRNAYKDGGFGYAQISPDLSDGIIKMTFEAFSLSPNHEYYVWRIIQTPGGFDPDLTISPNCFRSTHVADGQGSFMGGGSFPGPAAALSPGFYRIDVFVTPTDKSEILNSDETNLIRQTNLFSQPCGLEGLDLVLSSEPFETGIVLEVPGSD